MPVICLHKMWWCSFTLQVEDRLAVVTTQHDTLVAESEDRIKTATNAVGDLKQEKKQLLVQLEERDRCSVIFWFYYWFTTFSMALNCLYYACVSSGKYLFTCVLDVTVMIPLCMGHWHCILLYSFQLQVLTSYNTVVIVYIFIAGLSTFLHFVLLAKFSLQDIAGHCWLCKSAEVIIRIWEQDSYTLDVIPNISVSLS